MIFCAQFGENSIQNTRGGRGCFDDEYPRDMVHCCTDSHVFSYLSSDLITLTSADASFTTAVIELFF